MVQTPNKLLTLEEFLQLRETKPAGEYVNGKISQKPLPQGKHSTIKTELAAAINAVIKPAKRGRAFSELRCTFGDRSIVPDVSVYSWERIPRDANGKIANRFHLAPDWTIEILSPDQNQTKVVKNILYCLKNDTQLGWLIDPEEETVFVYFPKQEIEVFDDDEVQLPIPAFAQDFQLKLGALFNWLL
ncbi:MAG: Uma2 family endonuclease [Gomphosphaeria aponina SAG 52.96 = DSM 107014]|uniref:Uma2 family endonuclease n=1 Tax=Gomphosphaeria aponina SAG 52.96 = DSM 107014 TaxID=1521640 RepID=A0A941GMU1_9CHRO|nr:Uma2 family endonuclease [Gomphosphaeria aponina SAG 52.96 = DSM 107014]